MSAWPPFSPWMRRVALALVGAYVAQLALAVVVPADHPLGALHVLALSGVRVLARGEAWRLATWPLLDDVRAAHPLWSVPALWWVGSTIERNHGARAALWLLAAGALGGALAALLGAALHIEFYTELVHGPAAPVAGLLVGASVLRADEPLRPLGPLAVRGRTLARVLTAVFVVAAVVNRTLGWIAITGGALGGAIAARRLARGPR